MKYAVVTTFNEDGYRSYAKKMIESFLTNWPTEVKLYLYPERVNPYVPQGANVELIDLDTGVPELTAFKERWKNVPYANGDISSFPRLAARKDSHKPFKWDAIRFAHKVYTIFHCAKNTDADILIWMDADMVCHSPISMSEIQRLIPADKDLCYLGRDNKFSECGLYSLNLRSEITRNFLNQFQWMYDKAEAGIFNLDEWHDSYVFDDVRKRFPFLIQHNWSEGVITGEGHPLINCEWGGYLDHLKGERKRYGRSHQKDLRIKRKEDYWK